MCGLAYAHNFTGKPVNNWILNTFDKQRLRGTEGFGLFDGQEMNMVKATKEDKILEWLCKYDSNLIMFHHRYPTSTENIKRASHPFSTKDYFGDTQYILMHNGMIRNAETLYKAHQKLGIKYSSRLAGDKFNDSEALLWDFALLAEGKQSELKAYGLIAFICIKKVNGKLDKLYFGRNSNPLNFHREKNGIALSSEGVGESIASDTLYTYSYKLNRLTKKDLKINTWDANWDSGNSYYGGYYSGKYTSDSNSRQEDAWDDDNLPVQRTLPAYSTYQKEPEIEMPTPVQIENKAIEYLVEARGSFETAYWLAETDYEVLEDCYNDGVKEDLFELRLLEGVLGYIDDDPENTHPEAISSLYEALDKATAPLIEGEVAHG